MRKVRPSSVTWSTCKSPSASQGVSGIGGRGSEEDVVMALAGALEDMDGGGQVARLERPGGGQERVGGGGALAIDDQVPLGGQLEAGLAGDVPGDQPVGVDAAEESSHGLGAGVPAPEQG